MNNDYISPDMEDYELEEIVNPAMTGSDQTIIGDSNGKDFTLY